MSKFISLLIVLMALLVSASSFAFTPPPAPTNGGYVVDQAGRLSADQILQLNQKIDRISKATKNEFGVLLLQSMDGDNIEDVANSTYKAWGVGKRGLDNGCLIVVAIKERKSRIETGKGVEGEVTDLQASDILKSSLNPHLKQGDFFGAFNATLDSLAGLMETRANQKADIKPVVPVAAPPVVAQDSSNTGSETSAFGIFLFFSVLGVIGLIIFLVVRSRMREQERLAMLAREEQRERDRQRKEAERRAKAAQDEVNRRAKLHQEELNSKANDILGKMYASHGEPYRTPSQPPAEPKPVIHVPRQPLNKDFIKPEAAVAGASAAAVALAVADERRREEARMEREAREARAEESRRRREREEEDERARRRREEDSYSSSSSSSSSSDWGSSSGGGSDWSGGGFGGGDSGGGGSSGDW